MPSSPDPSPRRPTKRFLFSRALTLVLMAIAAFATLVLPSIRKPDALPLAVGDVAPQDLQAPQAIEYISEVRTEKTRESAASSVAPVYTPADPAIAREQIKALREALNYINVVRVDEHATDDEQRADLLALKNIQLEEETLTIILSLNDSQWETIQQEALSVLEQVMRNSIRQNDLAAVQYGVPSRVSLALSETQAQLVAELARAFIIPNSLYSESLTEAAQRSAREAVDPILKEYKAGEQVVSSGQIISAEDFEALQQFGLIQSDKNTYQYVGAGILTLVLAIFLWLYFRYRPSKLLKDIRSLIAAGLLFLIFLGGARLSIPNQTIIPYFYPLPAFGLLIAALFGADTAFVLILSLSFLATYGFPNALSLNTYYLLPSLLGILILKKGEQIWSFLRAGIAITLASLAILAVYWLPTASIENEGLIISLAVAAILNGIATSSLTLLLQFAFAQLLGLTTTLRLLEISRPDSPLLQLLLRKAPGTYQHSLQVTNLAEQAAEKIGADALLVRVGALFHDVGKMKNPLFFIENQALGSINTHEDLAPEESAAIIIRHVTDGVSLARKYRLPHRIIDFILEHHGSNITRYQYSQALNNADGDPDKVKLENFRYPGPAPRSRETALLMLADSTEAWSRAEQPQTEEELRALIHKSIETVQQSGQLDHTRLTLRDLTIIKESFVSTLRGTLHPRVQYPAQKRKTSASAEPLTKPAHPAK